MFKKQLFLWRQYKRNNKDYDGNNHGYNDEEDDNDDEYDLK